MTDSLFDHVSQLFSVLPAKEAETAARETLRMFRLRNSATAPELKWADLDTGGGFLRGGISTLSNLQVHLLHDPASDPDIADLAAKAKSGSVDPGRVMRAAKPDRFYWFLPFGGSSISSIPAQQIKGLVVTDQLFDEVISQFNVERGLTNAEIRVMFQLVAGLSLREAAGIDGTSVETKRSQAKSSVSKMSCTGQIDMIRMLTGQLVQLLSIADAEVDTTLVMERFFAQHFPGTGDLRIQRFSDGRQQPYLSVGPETGRPLVLIHGMMFPTIFHDLPDHLERTKLRLLIPIRQGFLQSFSMSSHTAEHDLLRHTLRDVGDLIAAVFGEPVPVIGHSLGSGLALQLASARPEAIKSLILISAMNLNSGGGVPKAIASHFFQGMRRLGEHPGLSRLVTWQFRRFHANEALSQRILARLFSSCPADIGILEGRRGRQPMASWFTELYQSSVTGIAEDLSFTLENEAALDVPPDIRVTFMHGGNDPITELAEVRGFADRLSGADVVEFPDAGHFLMGSHPDPSWSAIATQLNQP